MGEPEIDVAEAVRPLSGVDWWNTPAAAGVPALKVTDGPSGARGELFVGGPPSVWFPCGAALGATWDVDLVARRRRGARRRDAGQGRARAARARRSTSSATPSAAGTSSACPRTPCLTAHLAVAYIRGAAGRRRGRVRQAPRRQRRRGRPLRGVERRRRAHVAGGVAAALRARPARGAGSWSVMSAYNRLNGTHCSEHHWLLTEVLRERVGVGRCGHLRLVRHPQHRRSGRSVGSTSRCPAPRSTSATRSSRPSTRATSTSAVIDEQARPPPPARRAHGRDDVACRARRPGWADDVVRRRTGGCRRRHRAAAQRAVGVLPLDPLDASATGSRSSAPTPTGRSSAGGGSARLTPTAVATVLDGLRAPPRRRPRRPRAGVPRRPGHARHRRAPRSAAPTAPPVSTSRSSTPTGDVGCRLRPREFRAARGERAVARRPGATTGRCGPPARYEPDRTGRPPVQAQDQLRRAARRRRRRRMRRHEPRQRRRATVELVDGTPVGARGHRGAAAPTTQLFRRRARAAVQPAAARRRHRPRPRRCAAGADAAVVVIGLDGEWETEGRDRDDLVPARVRRSTLVRARRRRPTAHRRRGPGRFAGRPVDGPDDVPALVWGWFPGQEGGTPLADVLTGDRGPGGRLPCTMPARLEDTLAVRPGTGLGSRRLRGGRVHRAPPVRPRRHRAGVPLRLRPVVHDLRRRRPGAVDDDPRPRARAVTVADRRHQHRLTAPAVEMVQLYVRDVEASVSSGRTGSSAASPRSHLDPGDDADGRRIRARDRVTSPSGTSRRRRAGGPRRARSS